MPERPDRAAALGQHPPLGEIGQRAAEVQRGVERVGGLIQHVVADAVQHRFLRHGRKGVARRIADDRAAARPRGGEVRGEVGIDACRIAAIGVETGADGAEMGRREVQFKRRGMAEIAHRGLGDDAHLDALRRGLRRAVEQDADQRAPLVEGEGPVHHGEEVQIARIPAETAERQRSVDVEPDQTVAQHAAKIGGNPLEQRVCPLRFPRPALPPRAQPKRLPDQPLLGVQRLRIVEAARVPRLGVQVVRGVKELRDLLLAELRQRGKRRALLIHADAALLAAASGAGAGLAIERVGRPRLADGQRHALFGKEAGQQIERADVGRDLGGGRRVVKAGALVAHGAVGHDHGAIADAAVEHAAGAEREDALDAGGKQLVELSHSERRADGDHGQADGFAVDFDPVEGNRPIRAFAIEHKLRAVPLDRACDQVVRKAGDHRPGTAGHGRNGIRRIDDGGGRRIELRKRQAVPRVALEQQHRPWILAMAAVERLSHADGAKALAGIEHGGGTVVQPCVQPQRPATRAAGELRGKAKHLARRAAVRLRRRDAQRVHDQRLVPAGGNPPRRGGVFGGLDAVENRARAERALFAQHVQRARRERSLDVRAQRIDAAPPVRKTAVNLLVVEQRVVAEDDVIDVRAGSEPDHGNSSLFGLAFIVSHFARPDKARRASRKWARNMARRQVPLLLRFGREAPAISSARKGIEIPEAAISPPFPPVRAKNPAAPSPAFASPKWRKRRRTGVFSVPYPRGSSVRLMT